MMYGQGKSDGPVVPTKSPNNAAPEAAAEVMEEAGHLAWGEQIELPGRSARLLIRRGDL